MIDSFYIYSKATDMVKQTGTRNPMKIASEIGVMLRYSEELDKLLGLYTYRWKHRIILLNDKMEEIMARMVCAHELGHDALHRDIAKGDGLKEFVLFNMKDTTRPSQKLCKPPIWCKIEAPYWRFNYEQQKKTQS